MSDVENINPYGPDDGRDKAGQVEAMFDNIAPAYDLMNRLMTLGIDRLWRNRAIKLIAKNRHSVRYILDVASGTGDLAILMARRLEPVSITAVDLSTEMLEVGRSKTAAAGLADLITFSRADCLQLPFPDDTFDCVTAAYGVRNFENLEAGYREMFRVMRPGGCLMILELSTPKNKLIRPLYNIYTRHIIPLVGKLVSKDLSAYSYLPASIEAVPQGREMTTLMTNAGFSNTEFRTMTFGTCTIYLASKAADKVLDDVKCPPTA